MFIICHHGSFRSPFLASSMRLFTALNAKSIDWLFEKRAEPAPRRLKTAILHEI